MDGTAFLRRFRIQILLRLFLLGGTLALGCYFFLTDSNLLVVIIIGLLVTTQVISLLNLLERITRDLVSFLEAIEYSDFTQTFSAPFTDGSFSNLYGAFTKVMQAFQRTRVESEIRRQYLETLVHHVNIGLMCFQPDGEVTLLNNAAKRLLERPALHNIQDLEGLSATFVDTLLHISAGEQRLEKIDTGEETLQLAVNATRFSLQNQEYALVSLQNIGAELEDKELDAMQHMTRVLAHEIMNSITPIASLAATARSHLSQEAGSISPELPLDDLSDAMETIEKRSQGLLHFVNAYRSIARIPRPNFRLFEVEDLLQQVFSLLAPQFQMYNIETSIEVEPASLSVLADPDLIEQVLINLIKNAIQAVAEQEDGRIDVESTLDKRGRVLLRVTDNGPGMPPEVLDQIFIPFFTTKPDGSGIGLSFSRQVMRQHKGSLRVQSQSGGPTTFTLRF